MNKDEIETKIDPKLREMMERIQSKILALKQENEELRAENEELEEVIDRMLEKEEEQLRKMIEITKIHHEEVQRFKELEREVERLRREQLAGQQGGCYGVNPMGNIPWGQNRRRRRRGD